MFGENDTPFGAVFGGVGGSLQGRKRQNEKEKFPNLFNDQHPPAKFAQTLFSLFGEGQEQDVNLRPLGPQVVVDGYDVQVPVQWRGTYQERAFKVLHDSLKDLVRAAWTESGAVEGSSADRGAKGMGSVVFGWVGQIVRRGVLMRGEEWVEWDGKA